MEKREKKIVDTLKGMGKLRKGDQIIAEVTYVVLVLKEFITVDPFGSSPKLVEGMGQIKGTYRIFNPTEKVKPDETYTLELSDGKKIDTIMPSLILPGQDIQIYFVKAEGFK